MSRPFVVRALARSMWQNRLKLGICFASGRTTENSPAIHRWDLGLLTFSVPQGRKKPSLCRPCGTFPSPHRGPAMNRWAIFNTSLTGR